MVKIGEVVHLIKGPFAGTEARVLELRDDGQVDVAVALMGREHTMRVDADQLHRPPPIEAPVDPQRVVEGVSDCDLREGSLVDFDGLHHDVRHEIRFVDVPLRGTAWLSHPMLQALGIDRAYLDTRGATWILRLWQGSDCGVEAQLIDQHGSPIGELDYGHRGRGSEAKLLEAQSLLASLFAEPPPAEAAGARDLTTFTFTVTPEARGVMLRLDGACRSGQVV